ncbi:hypothetical protein A2U01_0081418, partial [Trifolium medium]|nr:hypothetical protein [Trifolium medium]
MSHCHAVYAILKGESIRVGSLIASSIKRMIQQQMSILATPTSSPVCARYY